MNQKTAYILSKAIKEAKWLDIKYEREDGEVSSFWIAVTGISDAKEKILKVEMINYPKYSKTRSTHIYADRIKFAKILEGVTYQVPIDLYDFIDKSEEELRWLNFTNRYSEIMRYFKQCAIYDGDPYQKKFTLVGGIDLEVLREKSFYVLNEKQLDQIVEYIKKEMNDKDKKNKKNTFCELALNLLAVQTKNGLLVFAYKPIFFDPKRRGLVLGSDVVFNQTFLVKDYPYSIHQYFDEGVESYIESYPDNLEEFHTEFSSRLNYGELLDENPYIMEIFRHPSVDYEAEYEKMIIKLKDNIAAPMKALFGSYFEHIDYQKSAKITLMDQNVNIDQLKAIYYGTTQPITYVQGPPGSGKTKTIVDLITSSYMNNSTVLITSNNNKPLDGILQKIGSIEYKGKKIPLPVIRLGNLDVVKDTINKIRILLKQFEKQEVYHSTLERQKEETLKKFENLSHLMKQLEEKDKLIHETNELMLMTKYIKEETKRSYIYNQLQEKEEYLHSIQDVDEESIIEELKESDPDFYKWLYYSSIGRVKRLFEEEYHDLKKIFLFEEEDSASKLFAYIKRTENLQKFLQVFPFVLSTNQSSIRLGESIPSFDLVIMDEAGQCSISNAVFSIIRGKRLMLIGDQNQLQPVITLDRRLNNKFMKQNKVPKEYDYCAHSILTLMRNIDPISPFVLLKYHYRCQEKIIEFSKKRYYNNQLIIKTKDHTNNSTIAWLTPKVDNSNIKEEKNTSLAEASVIIEKIKQETLKDVGIITPFTKQEQLIKGLLKEENMEHVEVGTIHKFQGEEKDTIFLSLAITNQTHNRTIDWIKNNKEMINVATTRPKNNLYIVGNAQEIASRDVKNSDLEELMNYVQSNGKLDVKVTNNYKVDTLYGNLSKENAFFKYFYETLNHIFTTFSHCELRVNVRLEELLKKQVKFQNIHTLDIVVFQDGNPIVAFVLDQSGLEVQEGVINQMLEVLNLKVYIIPKKYAKRYLYLKENIEIFTKKEDKYYGDYI